MDGFLKALQTFYIFEIGVFKVRIIELRTTEICIVKLGRTEASTTHVGRPFL